MTYSNTYKYDKDLYHIYKYCYNFVIHTLTNIIYHFFVAGIKLYAFITNLFHYSCTFSLTLCNTV